MLLRRRFKIVFGTVLLLVLFGLGLYYINEWWPSCNFAVAFSKGGEPLMVAAAKGGCTGCIRTLLRRGADPNSGDNVHGTPLVAAVQYRHYWTARLLLRRGAHVNAGTGAGTALCQAVMTESPDTGIIELLLNSGAALRWVGDSAQPDFSVFDCFHHSDAGPTRSEEVRRFAHLIDHGLVNVFRKLPEHRQAELLGFLYDEEIVQLARHGAELNLDVEDREGKTLISLGPRSCDRIRLLISEGAHYVPEDAEAINRCTK